MADFNLGRIKGDRGETGPKGDRGEKGEKGDKGESGRDGVTPVFSVAGTVTLGPEDDAYAEIDSTVPEAPEITFYIPKGKDGKDAGGDMIGAIYDPEGKKQNFYGYADTLFSESLKKSGGNLTGALKAAETSLEDGFVRNTVISKTLPEEGGNGDICILTEKNGNKTLSDCTEGTVVLIDENGTETPYIIVAKDFHESGSVTVMRQNLFPYELCFDFSKRGKYFMSDIDVFLETYYREMLPKFVQKNLVDVKVKDDIERRCFLLSSKEMKNMPVFEKESDRVASKSGESVKYSYFLRDLNISSKVYAVNSSGAYINIEQNEESYFRPTMALCSDIAVENVSYKDAPAVKIMGEKCGIYVFLDGEWKECASV